MEKLNTSLHSLREKQRDAFTLLPTPEQSLEVVPFETCKTVDELLSASAANGSIPDVSLLRCALHDLTADQEAPGATADQVFAHLESKLPSLSSEKGVEKIVRMISCTLRHFVFLSPNQKSLWETLNTSPAFRLSEAQESNGPKWTYSPPAPNPQPPSAPLIASLQALKSAIPPPTHERPFQHALQSLIDLTGYLTTQTYSFGGYRSSSLGFGSSSATLNPQEEDIRREIRALKGLVLNRYEPLCARTAGDMS
jgi:hypothetical protein